MPVGQGARRALRRAAVLVAVVLGLTGCAHRPPQPDAFITGAALLRDRQLFPPQAVFEASLLDLSDGERPPVVLGRQRLESAGQAPFTLAIPYPRAHFSPKGRYEVRASVTLEGRLLQATAQRYPVPHDAAFRRVNVQLQRWLPHPATVEAAVPLQLTYWRLIAIDGELLPQTPQHLAARKPAAAAPAPMLAPAAAQAPAPIPHLVLGTDEPRAYGSGGCNRFFADYTLRGGHLRFGSVTAGIGLCLPASALEERFVAALAAVASFRQEGDLLTLRGSEVQPLLQFRAAETPLE